MLFSAVLRIACFKYPSPSLNLLSGLPPQHLSRTSWWGAATQQTQFTRLPKDLAETSVSTRLICVLLPPTRASELSPHLPWEILLTHGPPSQRHQPSHSHFLRSYSVLGAALGTDRALNSCPRVALSQRNPSFSCFSACEPLQSPRQGPWEGPGPPLTGLQSPLRQQRRARCCHRPR